MAALSRRDLEAAVARAGGSRTYAVQWRPGSTTGRGLAEKAPPFELPTLRGEPYDFGAVLGKRPAVLVFWASWCTACVREAPVLAQLHTRYGDRVEVVSVSIDAEADRDALREIVKQLNLPYPVALDPDGSTIRAYTDRGAIPLTLFIDRAGRIVEHAGNFEPGDERRLVDLVERIAR